MTRPRKEIHTTSSTTCVGCSGVRKYEKKNIDGDATRIAQSSMLVECVSGFVNRKLEIAQQVNIHRILTVP